MLTFQPYRIMRLRNIEKPFAFLKSHGISHSTATKMIKGTCKEIKLAQLQNLCHILRCQLTDLFSYQPDSKSPALELDNLAPLIRSAEPPSDMKAILLQLPIDRLESLNKELSNGVHPQPPGTGASQA
jgi:DNA-binding Xre family transcriptional regulator